MGDFDIFETDMGDVEKDNVGGAEETYEGRTVVNEHRPVSRARGRFRYAF